jgi:general secretion pathway protein A
MYEKFYGLEEKPFSIVPDPAFLFAAAGHTKALTHLEYGIEENAGFILLTGEIGAGKTTLVRHLLNRIAPVVNVAEIVQTHVAPDQLVALVLGEFGLQPANGGKAKDLEILHDFLIEKYAAGAKALLVIDEAQNLSRRTLEEVRMLSNLQTDRQLLIQVLLVGQPELRRRLLSPQMQQLAQRIAVNYHLAALQPEETARYIAHRLQTAGGGPELFTQTAVERIHQASGGIPRTINLLCDTALVYGFADESPRIDAALIEAVIQDKEGIGLCASAEAQPSSHGTHSDDNGTATSRLDRIEAALQMLEARIDYQVRTLEQHADGYKAELQRLVEQLLQVERKRSDILLLKYRRLKEAYEVLINRPN